MKRSFNITAVLCKFTSLETSSNTTATNIINNVYSEFFYCRLQCETNSSNYKVQSKGPFINYGSGGGGEGRWAGVKLEGH